MTHLTLTFFALGVIFYLCTFFINWAYQLGREQGRKEADTWWIGAEAAADDAQKELWRANPLSGKGYKPEEWREWP